MTILALDTSTSVCSVALAKKTAKIGILAKVSIDRVNAHSERIMLMIEEVFEKAGVERKSIDAIALTIGPGSFTGLRIGLSVAKGLSFSWDCPIIGIPTLDVIADKYCSETGTVRIALTSRKNEFYTSAFQSGKNVSGKQILSRDELLHDMKDGGILVTDDLFAFGEQSNIKLIGRPHALPDMTHVFRCAYARAEANAYDDTASLVPEYWQGFRGRA